MEAKETFETVITILDDKSMRPKNIHVHHLTVAAQHIRVTNTTRQINLSRFLKQDRND